METWRKKASEEQKQILPVLGQIGSRAGSVVVLPTQAGSKRFVIEAVIRNSGGLDLDCPVTLCPIEDFPPDRRRLLVGELIHGALFGYDPRKTLKRVLEELLAQIRHRSPSEPGDYYGPDLAVDTSEVPF